MHAVQIEALLHHTGVADRPLSDFPAEIRELAAAGARQGVHPAVLAVLVDTDASEPARLRALGRVAGDLLRSLAPHRAALIEPPAAPVLVGDPVLACC